MRLWLCFAVQYMGKNALTLRDSYSHRTEMVMVCFDWYLFIFYGGCVFIRYFIL